MSLLTLCLVIADIILLPHGGKHFLFLNPLNTNNKKNNANRYIYMISYHFQKNVGPLSN